MGNRFTDNDLSYIKIKPQKEESEGKGLTPDQKRIHWETFAQKTDRQEIMFRRALGNVLGEQAEQVVAELKRTGQLPPLNDEQTARKFKPAIELVYESAFEDAI